MRREHAAMPTPPYERLERFDGFGAHGDGDGKLNKASPSMASSALLGDAVRRRCSGAG